MAMNEGRLERVLSAMEREGLEQILVTSPSAVAYLTGVNLDPMERLLALYLNKKGRRVLFGNKLFGLEPMEGLELQEHTDADNPVEGISRELFAGKIGIDGNWRSQFLIGLMELRADITPVQGSLPMQLAMMQKDEEERERMRVSSRLNDRCMEAVAKAIDGGLSELELMEVIVKFFKENKAKTSGFAIVAAGANGSDPHHVTDNSLIREGDGIVFDIGAPLNGYWSDMTRTIFYKSVSEEQRKVYETVLAANLAGIAAVKPGVPLGEIDKAARSVIEAAGYGEYFIHRTGHCIGMECHEAPSVGAGEKTLALPGMCFSIEPGIYLPGKFGVRIEDLVLVTEDGCEVLNSYPKELQVVGN